MDKRMRFLEMEVVRLNNRLASRDEYVSFLESELKSVESEHAEELALKDEFIAGQAETHIQPAQGKGRCNGGCC